MDFEYTYVLLVPQERLELSRPKSLVPKTNAATVTPSGYKKRGVVLTPKVSTCYLRNMRTDRRITFVYTLVVPRGLEPRITA